MAFNLNDYETVEDRLFKFWSDNPNGRVETELVKYGDGQFIVKATIYRTADDDKAWATGFAEEKETGRGVNATSALENCETSAIGRALANAGYATRGKRPSREEMTKAKGVTVTPDQANLKKLLAAAFSRADDRKAFLEAIVGRALSGVSDLTPEEINQAVEALTTKENNNAQ